MGVGVELFNADDGRSVMPGYYAPPYFRCSGSMLVADIGDTVLVKGETWEVIRRAFTYERIADDNEDCYSVAHLYCKRVGGLERDE